MNLVDGLKLKGAPAEIPDCSRDELPDFFVKMGYKVGAEIGVHIGAFTEKFCKAGLKMYAIDPWTKRDSYYEHARRVLAPYKKCKIIRKTSMDAVKDFETRSLDFVYIDGDHRFPFIAEDIYQWYWKVKKSGIISGHDYSCTDPETNKTVLPTDAIVDAFVKVYKIENFYIFGRSKPIGLETKDDKYLSWMFVKP